jgi:hypothetical protein
MLNEIGMLAIGGLKWTPVTYYVVAGIVHFLLIVVGFRLMGVDPEQNGVFGALIGAVLINVIQYFVRDTGVVGALIVGLGTFALLAGITSGEVLKAAFMTILVIASYGGIGAVIFPRTPLEIDDAGGFTRVVMTGGLEPEPITEDDTDKLTEGVEEEE